ncbi:MAG: VOC family protein [Candidatus Methanofastidiosia archaeon]
MTKINHIAICVKDLTLSTRFYRDVLGLEVVFDHPLQGKQFDKVTGISGFNVVFAVLSDKITGINVELVEFKNPFEEKPSSFNHIAFEVEDVDKLYQKLTGMGIKTVSEPVTLSYPHPKIDGKRFFYFPDPDGNIIEVFNRKKGLYSD